LLLDTTFIQDDDLPAPAVIKRRTKRHSRTLPLRVGTRRSPLALVQTRNFLDILRGVCPVLRGMNVFEEHAIQTTGDAVLDRRLADIGGKGLFAKEIDEAQIDGRIDFAVHSLKDLETHLPPGIILACTLKREDARDTIIFGHPVDPTENPYDALPYGALVGTSSVRRQAQLLHARPDLQMTTIRGNVQSRLAKVRAGDCSASLLALAGLKRLGMEHEASVILDPDVMVPSAAQGIVGVTVHEDDIELLEMLKAIEDPEARAVSTAERALLAVLDGSCHTPIGGHARILPNGRLRLTGLVARADGTFLLKRTLEGLPKHAQELGEELGWSLKLDTPPDVFK